MPNGTVSRNTVHIYLRFFQRGLNLTFLHVETLLDLFQFMDGLHPLADLIGQVSDLL